MDDNSNGQITYASQEHHRAGISDNEAFQSSVNANRKILFDFNISYLSANRGTPIMTTFVGCSEVKLNQYLADVILNVLDSFVTSEIQYEQKLYDPLNKLLSEFSSILVNLQSFSSECVPKLNQIKEYLSKIPSVCEQDNPVCYTLACINNITTITETLTGKCASINALVQMLLKDSSSEAYNDNDNYNEYMSIITLTIDTLKADLNNFFKKNQNFCSNQLQNNVDYIALIGDPKSFNRVVKRVVIGILRELRPSIISMFNMLVYNILPDPSEEEGSLFEIFNGRITEILNLILKKKSNTNPDNSINSNIKSSTKYDAKNNVDSEMPAVDPKDMSKIKRTLNKIETWFTANSKLAEKIFSNINKGISTKWNSNKYKFIGLISNTIDLLKNSSYSLANAINGSDLTIPGTRPRFMLELHELKEDDNNTGLSITFKDDYFEGHKYIVKPTDSCYTSLASFLKKYTELILKRNDGTGINDNDNKLKQPELLKNIFECGFLEVITRNSLRGKDIFNMPLDQLKPKFDVLLSLCHIKHLLRYANNASENDNENLIMENISARGSTSSDSDTDGETESTSDYRFYELNTFDEPKNKQSDEFTNAEPLNDGSTLNEARDESNDVFLNIELQTDGDASSETESEQDGGSTNADLLPDGDASSRTESEQGDRPSDVKPLADGDASNETESEQDDLSTNADPLPGNDTSNETNNKQDDLSTNAKPLNDGSTLNEARDESNDGSLNIELQTDGNASSRTESEQGDRPSDVKPLADGNASSRTESEQDGGSTGAKPLPDGDASNETENEQDDLSTNADSLPDGDTSSRTESEQDDLSTNAKPLPENDISNEARNEPNDGSLNIELQTDGNASSRTESEQGDRPSDVKPLADGDASNETESEQDDLSTNAKPPADGDASSRTESEQDGGSTNADSLPDGDASSETENEQNDESTDTDSLPDGDTSSRTESEQDDLSTNAGPLPENDIFNETNNKQDDLSTNADSLPENDIFNETNNKQDDLSTNAKPLNDGSTLNEARDESNDGSLNIELQTDGNASSRTESEQDGGSTNADSLPENDISNETNNKQDGGPSDAKPPADSSTLNGTNDSQDKEDSDLALPLLSKSDSTFSDDLGLTRLFTTHPKYSSSHQPRAIYPYNPPCGGKRKRRRRRRHRRRSRSRRKLPLVVNEGSSFTNISNQPNPITTASNNQEDMSTYPSQRDGESAKANDSYVPPSVTIQPKKKKLKSSNNIIYIWTGISIVSVLVIFGALAYGQVNRTPF